MNVDETTTEIRRTGKALKDVATLIRETTAGDSPEEAAASRALAVLLEQIAEHGAFVPVAVRDAAWEVTETLRPIMA